MKCEHVCASWVDFFVRRELIRVHVTHMSHVTDQWKRLKKYWSYIIHTEGTDRWRRIIDFYRAVANLRTVGTGWLWIDQRINFDRCEHRGVSIAIKKASCRLEVSQFELMRALICSSNMQIWLFWKFECFTTDEKWKRTILHRELNFISRQANV